MVRRIKYLFCIFAYLLHVSQSRTTTKSSIAAIATLNRIPESENEEFIKPYEPEPEFKEEIDTQKKFSECTKIKRMEDCLPVLYSTAILAVVTTFLLTLCGAFICCMICCAARLRSRDMRLRMMQQYALVAQRSSELSEFTSPRESLQCPSRYNPDPPPKYPGPKVIITERISSTATDPDDPPPPPYTPSFRKAEVAFTEEE
jgi:hypothetical protein